MTVVVDDDMRVAWDRALDVWGVRLRDPKTPDTAAADGPLAWFDFPPSVTVDVEQLRRRGAAAHLESVLAHEIGHHVVAPSTRLDALRIRQQLARALDSVAPAVVRRDAPLAELSNMWCDLVVNHRLAILQRRRDPQHEPGIALSTRALFGVAGPPLPRLWWVYCRAYELLWNLPPGTLASEHPPEPPEEPRLGRRAAGSSALPVDPDADRAAQAAAARADVAKLGDELARTADTHPQADARTVADAVHAFAGDPVSGALRFGLVAAHYVREESRAAVVVGVGGGSTGLGGSAGCAADTAPPTAEELGRVLADPRLRAPLPALDGSGEGAGQALGLSRTVELWHDTDPAVVLAAWYRAEAAQWVRPLLERRPPPAAPELPGPLELWEVDDDPADIDWPATLTAGPVVAGVTTRRRSWLDDESPPSREHVDLEVYVDSSGSMPRPERGSPAVLAGAILVLSALRGGGRVRVTSFSGPGQVAGEVSWTRDPMRAMTDLAVFFGGGTTFPLDLFARRGEHVDRSGPGRRHLVVLSDDGLVSMFGAGDDERRDVARRIRPSFASATLLLLDTRRAVAADASAAGYDVEYLTSMADAPAAAVALARRLDGRLR